MAQNRGRAVAADRGVKSPKVGVDLKVGVDPRVVDNLFKVVEVEDQLLPLPSHSAS